MMGLVMNRGKDLERESFSDLRYSARKEGEDREECSGILFSDLFAFGRSVSARRNPKSATVCALIIPNQNFEISMRGKQRSLMAQSQLIGKAGDLKNGEGARKRLRISVPHFDNSEIIKNYSRTLIGRCMNPEEKNMTALVTNLPKIWNVENRVVGVDLGHGKFQFDFDKEEDIEEVMKNQPYHFDYGMLSLARWQPKRSNNFPSEITFWIRVIGVPLEFWAEPSFETIRDAIGKTVEVDLDFGRVKVVVDGFKELVFDTTVDFTGGEFHDGLEEWVSLKYEKLFGYCETCYSLCHGTDKCPLTRKSPMTKQTHKSDDGRGHDDRARSYRGVVLNGNKGHQDRERGSRDYYGKGKGKMIEEQNSKWTKVADREHKRSYSTRSHSSGDGESSRRRGPRRENQRPATPEARSRDNREGKERSPRRARNGCVREEGEIHNSGVRVTQQGEEIRNQKPPSKAFQEALLKTQEEPKKVISQIGEENLGLTMSNELIEDRDAGLSVEEDRMDLDLSIEGKENVDEDFQDLTEEEIKEEEAVPKEDLTKEEEEKHNALAEGKDRAPGDVGKKQGVRRNAFVAGGTSKMRMVQTFLANPKKNAAKAGTRREESSKQTEEKGPSNPQPAPPKP
ncbi:hypothetical protein Bca101_083034 [Brassica carinata]